MCECVAFEQERLRRVYKRTIVTQRERDNVSTLVDRERRESKRDVERVMEVRRRRKGKLEFDMEHRDRCVCVCVCV